MLLSSKNGWPPRQTPREGSEAKADIGGRGHWSAKKLDTKVTEGRFFQTKRWKGERMREVE